MKREEALKGAAEKLEKAGCPEPKADAEVLLAHVLGIERPRLLLDRRLPLGGRARAVFDRRIARRVRREPVAYITGEREFWSLPFHVSPSVLIPRPETETLVEVGLELLEKEGFHVRPSGEAPAGKPGGKRAAGPRVIDVGTGSGCVAVAIAHAHPRAKVLALDCSARALAVAAKNVARHDLRDRVEIRRADLLAPGSSADLILSNPPYVAEREWRTLQPEIRDREPRLALLAGPDGLDVHRRIAAGAAAHLRPGGWIALEVGAGQAKAVAALYGEQALFTEIKTVSDLAGIPRVVAARKKDRKARRAPGARG